MAISKTQCCAVTGLMALSATIALLSVSLASPAFFRSYYVNPEGSNFEYPNDSYGDDCDVANIGLLTSKYNPLCSGGLLSGKIPFEVSTTEYYPLFPIRLIDNKYNPLNSFGLSYTGCDSTIQSMYNIGAGQASQTVAQLVPLLSLLPDAVFTDSSLWVVPSGPGYQGLQQALVASGQDEETQETINATLVPVLQGCTAAPDSSRASCAIALEGAVMAGGEQTINGYLTIAFNKPINGKDEAVAACEDDNVDYEVLEKAKHAWIAAIVLGSVGFLAGVAVLFVDGKKGLFAAASAAVFVGGTGICLLIAFMELNHAPATKDVGGDCVAGVACYEKQANVMVGMASMITAIIAGCSFLAYGIIVFMDQRKAANGTQSNADVGLGSGSDSDNEERDMSKSTSMSPEMV